MSLRRLFLAARLVLLKKPHSFVLPRCQAKKGSAPQAIDARIRSRAI
jgi:hypothetical protein